jgi:hypothetical protein
MTTNAQVGVVKLHLAQLGLLKLLDTDRFLVPSDIDGGINYIFNQTTGQLIQIDYERNLESLLHYGLIVLGTTGKRIKGHDELVGIDVNERCDGTYSLTSKGEDLLNGDLAYEIYYTWPQFAATS